MNTDHTLFTMEGNSMYPTLHDKDKGLMIAVSPCSLRKGDIVVFDQRGTWLAHRLVKTIREKNETIFITRGDHNRFPDQPFTEKAVKGVIKAYYRNGKLHGLNSFKHRIIRFNTRYLPLLSSLIRTLRFRAVNRSNQVKGQIKTFIHHLKRVLSGSEKDFTLNAFLAILQGILPFLLIISIKELIDSLTNPSLQVQGYIGRQEWLWLILTAILFLSSGVLMVLSTYFSDKLQFQISRHAFRLLHEKHARLGLADYEQSSKQDSMHRAAQEASFRPVKLTIETLVLIRSLSSLTIMLVLFFQIKGYLVLLLLAAILPGFWIRLRYANRRYHLKQNQSPRERRMYYFSRLLTNEAFAKESRLFHFSDRFKNRFEKLENELYTEKRQLSKAETRADLLAQIFAVTLLFASLVLVIQLALSGKLTIGTVVLFFFVFQRGYSVLGEAFRSVTRLAEDTIFLDDFIRFLDQPEPTVNAPGLSGEPMKKNGGTSLKQTITVENVHFSYAGSQREALAGINLSIPVGQTIALVGPNGSGKTTLMKLLCGFYTPSEGQIFYDNRNLTDLNTDELRGQITAVFQDYALYNLSASENIGMGNTRQPFNLEKAKQAARDAGVEALLERLPEGYETLLGHLFNSGEDLSIGQWQKIAIARAFYRDTPLLFMDEPSSALDAGSERQILESLRKLGKNKTVLIISHRLSSVQWADCIYVLDKGKIVEEGTHETLMVKHGLYAELYQTNQRSDQITKPR